jgi:uncharacterized protein
MPLSDASHPMPLSRILAVLIGFPILSTLLSLLLLDRTLITQWGLDFFNTFWILVSLWYLLQMLIVSRILRSHGWTLSDIGYPFTQKKTLYLIAGYFAVALLLLAFIEWTLAHGEVDQEKWDALSSLTPRTTTARVIFIVMAFCAGMAEEWVYRGFAIRSLESVGIQRWIAVVLASIPFIFQHGLKSMDQFWWFLNWGIVFGALFLILKRLTSIIIIHWLVILSAMVAILQVVK